MSSQSPKRLLILSGLGLLSVLNAIPARAGAFCPPRGQLIAVPMQTPAVATQQMSYAQPAQMSYAQPVQMSYMQPVQMSYTQPVQMSFSQPTQPQMSFSTAASTPNVTINISDAAPQPAQSFSAPPPQPTPNVTINITEAPSQPTPAAGVPPSAQSQMSYSQPRPQAPPQPQQSYSQPPAQPQSGYYAASGVPANAIPMQLYLAPRAFRSHHLFDKQGSIYVLRP